MLASAGILDRRYRVDRLVGEGGFGAVYAGLHLTLGSPVAIKVTRFAAGIDANEREEAIQRFMEEGRLLTRLRHPNIVSVLDLGLVQDTPDGLPAPYLVMEWVEGVTLRAYLDANRRAHGPLEAWRIFEPLAAAVAYAHAAHIAHRDLTPNNVMIVRDAAGAAVPRVIDFGMAKAVTPADVAGRGQTYTTTPSAFTAAYGAPEQVTLSRTGTWTDVHALGLLLAELLTGISPYGRTDDPRAEIVDPIRPTPRARGIDVGPLEPVLARALALRPADRFANAGELLEAVRRVVVAPGALAVTPPPPPWGPPALAPGQQTGAPASHTLGPGARRAGTSRGVVIGVSIGALLALVGGAGVLALPRVLPLLQGQGTDADAGAATPVTTTTAAKSTSVAPSASSKHAPVPSPQPTPSPSPAPSPSPTPTPPPSPTPTPGRTLEFSAGPGTYGGLYPKDAELLAVANGRSAALRSCFPATVTDAWSVRVRVTFQKDGTRVLSLSTNHEGSPDTSAVAKSLEACHETAIKGWPWPSSAGIEGVNGGAGYMIILSSMVWRAR